MRRLRTVLLLALALPLCQQAAWGRKWTDVTGTYSVEAELLGVADGVVRLRRSDGQEVRVPILKLSAADRTFLRAKMKQGSVAPPRPAKGPKAKADAKRMSGPKGAAPLNLAAVLDKTVRFSAPDLPLSEVAKAISEQSGMSVFIDGLSLREAGYSERALIPLKAKRLTVREALEAIASDDSDLEWWIREQVVVITTYDAMESEWMSTKVYVCQGNGAAAMMAKLMRDIEPNSWSPVGGPADAASLGPRVLVIRQRPIVHREILRTMGASLKLVQAPKPTSMGPVADKLRQPIDWTLRDFPLDKFCEQLAKDLGVNAVLDVKALTDEGIDPGTPISATLSNTTAENGLRLVLAQDQLSWSIDGAQLTITSASANEACTATASFDVRPLVGRGEGFDSLMSCIQRTIRPDSWEVLGGEGKMNPTPNGLLQVKQSTPGLWEIRQLLDDLLAVGR